MGFKFETYRESLSQVAAVSVKNLLLISFGMTLGFPTIVIPALEEKKAMSGEISLNEDEISWFSSINLICVPVGCAVSGLVTQPVGRRRSMQFLNIPFLTAWLIFYFSSSITELYVALCLTGLAGGLLEAPVLTYVAEVTRPHLRGLLAASSTMCISIGIFTQFLLGTFLYWRTIALVNMAFPILAFICLFFIPESPHWLIMKTRLDDAKSSLSWLRGWKTHEETKEEFDELYNQIKRKEHEEKPSLSVTLELYTKRNFYLPFFLVSSAFFIGHFSGMTTLQTYAVQIFTTLKAPIDKYFATMILGVAQLLGTLSCVVLVHFVGKRPLTFFSMFGCAICFITVAVYAFLLDPIPISITGTNNDSTETNWLPMTFLIGGQFLSHMGIRLLPWMLIGEVYPIETRGVASGLTAAAGYFFGFIANKVFISMVASLTLPGTYIFYSGISIIGAAMLYFMLPETEGRTLRDIELHFNGEQNLIFNKKKDKTLSKDIELNKVVNS